MRTSAKPNIFALNDELFFILNAEFNPEYLGETPDEQFIVSFDESELDDVKDRLMKLYVNNLKTSN